MGITNVTTYNSSLLHRQALITLRPMVLTSFRKKLNVTPGTRELNSSKSG